MPHQQKVTLIEIKSREGILLLPPFYLYATELNVEGKPTFPTSPPATGKNGGSTNKEDDPMSDAQKRLLYRLMADQGFEGEAATQELRKRLGVTNLKEATKQESSNLIQQLLEEAKVVEA